MDGRFVPNITFGSCVVRAIRPLTRLPLETHLMVSPPEDFIDAFAEAGADLILVQQESTPHLHRALEHIRSLGKKAGVVLNPSTPASTLSEVLSYVQEVLIMTVNPGFGGQKFIPETLPKIRQVRDAIIERRFDCEVEVDGGINEQTAALVVDAGADVLVAGSSVFGAPDGPGPAITRLLNGAAMVRH